MKKTTRKALVTSLLAMVLCVSMLVGSTFAWFTDTDTTAVSNIVSGTLDVEIVDKDGNPKTDALKFVNKDGSSDILWEPGATFQTEGFQLKNVGNLWLKCKVEVNNTEVSYNKLNEVITFTLVDADGKEVSLDALTDLAIEPKTATETLYIRGTMSKDAGNEYQDLTLSGVSITVYATQYTKEVDMTDDRYDANAVYPVVKAEDVNKALAEAAPGSVVQLGNTSEPIVVDQNFPAGVTITGNGDDTVLAIPATGGANLGAGTTISNVVISDANESNGRYYTGIVNLRGDNATLQNATVNGKGATTWDAAVYVNLKAGETAYITNTQINGGFRGVFLGSQSGSLIIDGCTINPVAYTISVDGGGDFTLVVKNSTLNGWLSYSAIKSATFTGCKFGSNGSYAFFRPYSATTLTNCDFETGYEIDASKAPVTLVGCTLNGVALTTQNAGALFGGTVPANVTIR